MTQPKDALETLGTLIDANQSRDAIHLAVYPCQAGEHLERGERVWLNDKGKAIGEVNQPEDGPQTVGIVDPFLEQRIIYADEWFWLILYPRSVTSLRHHWEHPAFPASTEIDWQSRNEALQQVEREHQIKLLISDPEALARQKIREIASNVKMTEHQLLAAAHDFLVNGVTISLNNIDYDLDDTFWDAYETLTDTPVSPLERDSFFHCAC